MASRSNVNTPATRLLDYLIAQHQLKNDAALSRLLGIAPPVISKIRYNRLGISAAIMIIIHEKCSMSIAAIKEFLTDKAAA